MVELTCPDRENRQQPLYQEMFVLLEEDLRIFHLGQAESRPVAMSTRTSKCELTLSILAKGPRWPARWNILGFVHCGNGGADGRALAGIAPLLHGNSGSPYLPPKSVIRDRATAAVSGMEPDRTDYPRDQCIHRLFEEQVARTPEGWPWCLRAIR